MINAVIVWFVIALVFCTVELISPGLFFFLSFALSAAVMAGISLLVASATVQTTIFFALSALFFLVLTRAVRRHRNREQPSNVDAYRGKRVFIAAVVPLNRQMYVHIGGERWVAHCENSNEVVAVGTPVEILRVEGCHMVIRTINEHQKELS